MPTHVHFFVQGSSNFILSNWIRILKRCLSQEINLPRPHWQTGFFDHLIRNQESYMQKWNYVRENPVRANLVKQADDWPYQSEIIQINHG